jgi:hypothetical protein
VAWLAACLAKSSASAASAGQGSLQSGATVNHSRIGVPLFASNRAPWPAVISSSTRWPGSLTTRAPRTNIAKILPRYRSALRPKPLPPCGSVTPSMSLNSPSRSSKRISGERSAVMGTG